MTPARWAVVLLLFMLLHVAFSRLLAAVFGREGSRRFRFRPAGRAGIRPWPWRRTAGGARGGFPAAGLAGFAKRPFGPAGTRSLADLLVAAEANLSPAAFAALSAAAGVCGLVAGAALFGHLKGVLIPGAAGFLLPSLWLRNRLAGRQLKRRKDLLPALESFYQEVVLSPGRNIRAAIRRTVESGRLPRHAQSVFERLHAELAVRRDPEDGLRLFAASFSSRWADQFAGLLRIALEDGADVTEGLRELVSDMRRAQRNDQAERNRLLEIRLVSFSPLAFLAVFLAVNFRLDPAMAHRHYIASEAGRDMLLHALVMIVLSTALGLYLSLRKE